MNAQDVVTFVKLDPDEGFPEIWGEGNDVQKKPIGRPRIEKEPQSRRNVALAQRHIDKAKRIGEGNVSAGIRAALEAYKE